MTNPTSSLNLLPCPFCGASAHEAPSGPSGLVVRCDKCSARTVSDFPDHARRDWNKRARSEIPVVDAEEFVLQMVEAYDNKFIEWEKHNPGRLPVGASSDCMEAVFELIKPYLLKPKQKNEVDVIGLTKLVKQAIHNTWHKDGIVNVAAVALIAVNALKPYLTQPARESGKQE